MNAPAELIEAIWGKPFHPIDLTQITDEDLLNQSTSGILLYVFKPILAELFHIGFHMDFL